MATDHVKICGVCTDEFDDSRRQSVSLPCGHNFCLSCLVRLRAKGKHKCPRCRRNWEKFVLPFQSGMRAHAMAHVSEQEDKEDDMAKKQDADDRCKKHSSPYDFWVNAKKEFYCRKCAAEDTSGAKLAIIEEAIPQIQAALAADVPEAKKRLEDDLESLDKKHANLVKKRNSVRKFGKAVKALEDNFDQEIEKVAAKRTKALNSSDELKKVDKKIPNITSPADLAVAMECRNTLQRVGAPSSAPASDLPQTLLSTIACCYEEGATLENPPSKASFVNALLKGSSVSPLTEEVGPATTSNNDDEGRNKNVDRPAGVSSEVMLPKTLIQYVWQYEDDNGWTTYGQIPSRNSSGSKTATSDDIELHYLANNEHCPLVIEINNVQYLLDFQKNTQTISKTNAPRRIRRIVKPTMDDHSAGGNTQLSSYPIKNTVPAFVHRDLPTNRPNNYDKHCITNVLSVKHVWQFEDQPGKWITYGKSNSVFDIIKATTSDDIEKVYSKEPNRAIMRIQSKNKQYILDLRKMTQTNEQTQVQRRVRRVPEHTAQTSVAEKVNPFDNHVESGREYINFEWQFEDENRMWITYGRANSAGMYHCTTTVTSDDIEKYYNSSPKKRIMTIKSITNDYVLDFDAMTQTNVKTSVQRRIRRIPVTSKENKPQNAFGSSSSYVLYPNLPPLNSAIGNPNSAPSYAMAAAYGGIQSTHGHGGGHGSGAGDMHSTHSSAGAGNGSGAGNIHTIHSGAGARDGSFNNNGSGAGNIHTSQSGAGGGTSNSYRSGAGNIHTSQSGAGGGVFNSYGSGAYNHEVNNSRPGNSPYSSSFQ